MRRRKAGCLGSLALSDSKFLLHQPMANSDQRSETQEPLGEAAKMRGQINRAQMKENKTPEKN